MLLERAELTIKSGNEEQFAKAMAERGKAILSGVPGVKSVSFGRGIENPDKFMLLVEWASLDAHAAYQKSPACQQFRELVAPHSRGGAMEHFNMS